MTNGVFDFDKAMDNIYLCGKKISLPTTLEELGSDFTFESIFKPSYASSEKEDVLTGLSYKGEEIGSFILLNCTPENFNEKTTIGGISVKGLLQYEEEEGKQPIDFGFYNLKLESKTSESELKSIFGETLIVDYGSVSTVFYYNKNENQGILIQLDKDNKIKYLSIDNKEEK
jgi:hypothetical protein